MNRALKLPLQSLKQIQNAQLVGQKNSRTRVFSRLSVSFLSITFYLDSVLKKPDTCVLSLLFSSISSTEI